jgi:predicted nuclease of restriction endonuclease-like RecB superfamily
LPAAEPTRFDSQVKRHFARDFGAVAPDWDLIREPEAVPLRGASCAMIFPDFLIRHRRDSKISFYLEIVGYWTQDYLIQKIQSLRLAGIPNLILCIDESLGCGEKDNQAEIEKLGSVIFFRRKIRVEEVLARMNLSLASPNVFLIPSISASSKLLSPMAPAPRSN